MTTLISRCTALLVSVDRHRFFDSIPGGDGF